MPWKLAQTGLTTMLEPWNIPIYAHTVNDPDLFRELQASGVDGIYTDIIVPH
jgi:glycerophosphoryl diester phosphodiesterase